MSKPLTIDPIADIEIDYVDEGHFYAEIDCIDSLGCTFSARIKLQSETRGSSVTNESATYSLTMHTIDDDGYELAEKRIGGASVPTITTDTQALMDDTTGTLGVLGACRFLIAHHIESLLPYLNEQIPGSSLY